MSVTLIELVIPPFTVNSDANVPVFTMAEAVFPTDALVDLGEVNGVGSSLVGPAVNREVLDDLHNEIGDRMKDNNENEGDIRTLNGIRSAHRSDILLQFKYIKQHISERGSRSALLVLRSMLADKLEALTEAHINYATAMSLSYTAQQKAYSEYVGKLECKARQTNREIEEYLQSRENDYASVSHSDSALNQIFGEDRDQRYAEILEQTRRRRRLLEQHLAHQSAAIDYGQQLLSETPRRRVEFGQQQQLPDQMKKTSISQHFVETEHDEFYDETSIQPKSANQVFDPRVYGTVDRNSRRISHRPVDDRDYDDIQPERGARFESWNDNLGPDDWISNRTSSQQPRNASAGAIGAAGASGAAGVIGAAGATWLANVIPKVKIPPFNGDPKEWPTFISSFRDMIHDVVPSNAQRMAILKQLLTTEVRAYVAEYLSTPSLYYEALAALKKRYGHPQIVARAHLRGLISLPSVREDDFAGIAKLSRAIYGSMHALQTGGYEQDLQSGMVLEQIVEKLPPKLRNNWGVKLYRMMPKRATLRDLAQWLDEFSMGYLMTNSSMKPKPDGNNSRGKRNHNHNNNLGVFATTHDSNAVERPKCVACNAVNHKIYSCSVFKALDIPSRADLVKEKGLCFRCLNTDHRVKDCRSKFTCDAVPGCKGAHHRLLHGAPRVYQPQSNSNVRQTQNSADPSVSFAPSVNMVSNLSKPPTFITLLNVVPIKVIANGKVFKTFALLDNGSDVSLIRQDVANYLNLIGPKRRVTFNTFHGEDPAIDTMTVNFLVKSVDESFEVSIYNASTVPRLNLSRRSFNLQALQRRWPHLAEVKSGSINYSEVTVLIGAGAQEAHQHLDTRIPPKGTTAPYGILTPFGWCCVGMLPTRESSNDDDPIGQVFAIGAPIDDLHTQVCKFWETDSFGTQPGLKPLMSDADQQALEVVETTTKHNGVRYIVGLPWISPDLKLPNNFSAAAKRFAMLERRFQKDTAFADRYKAVIEEYISLGHAQKMSADQPVDGRVWYLPHHGVVNPQKPNKVRVVFDASARFNNVSLNSSLLKGPVLLNDISAVLTRFRQRAIPISADIQKMFHQVGVREQDQSALRFLWRSPGDQGPIQTYQMRVQIFGAVSSPFVCGHILQRTAKDHYEEFSDVADKVLSNFYVDNLLDSFDTEEDTIRFVQRIRSLLKRGGFHLNQWLSSSRAVLATLPPEDRSQPTLNLDLDELPSERTLGVLWDSESDSFKFKIKLDSEANTKRKILRVVASIYDPLGLLAPVVITAKKILQDIWQTGADWDDIIQINILDQWFRWMNELLHLEMLSVPRAFTSSSQFENIQLHVFSDASEVGFGAVIYIRVDYGSSVSVSFVIAKSRVAPLRPLSIPRLELQGAVVGLRLLKETANSIQLPINNVLFWTDSNTVLQWINSKKRRFHTFVANRVAEILDGSKQVQWRHVPGVENPADELSRGLLPTQLSFTDRWFNGPNFLRLPEGEWPKQITVTEPSDDDQEIKTKWIGHISLELVDHIEPYLDRSSKFIRVRRVLAYVLRFIQLCRAKRCKSERLGEFLTPVELRNAELICFRKAQQDAFAKELFALNNGKAIRKDSHLIKLTPFLDSDGLIRVGGRLQHGDFPYSVKHPILLPFNHHVTRLVVIESHLELHHPSKERLLSHLRQRFWIIRGRAAIRQYVHSCFICKKKRAIPVPPIMSALPRHRLEAMQPPFTNTGIDFFGPMNVVILRRTVKRYGLLFTCLVTRAVHIEITHSMDTDSFLMGFQRFQNRRGRPAVIYSDNGTQLVAGEKELREGLSNLNQSKLSGYFTNLGIEWHFSPPAAPHFGGVWESLVKSAKIAILSVVNMRSLSDEVLLSVIAEAESLLNSRPLTHISVDPSDPEPLTPNHFLLGRSSPNIPYDIVEDHQITSRRRWKAAQVIVNHFWQRWLREYLPSLTERRKWLQSSASNLKKGDIVLIADPNTPRGQWPVGHIVQPIVSKDKVVRAAIVKTKSGVYQRPVVKLCLLEAE